jgi:hypothetical protein
LLAVSVEINTFSNFTYAAVTVAIYGSAYIEPH